MLHLTICERDLLFERRFACRTLDLCVWNTTFSHRAVSLSASSPFSFSSASLFLDCAAVGEGRSEYLLLCKKQAEVAFSWLRAQRKRLVFPAVSDCSRPAECKHALMCGAALCSGRCAGHLGPWGLRFGLTECPFVLFLTPPKFPPTFTSPLFTATGRVKLIFYNTFCLS